MKQILSIFGIGTRFARLAMIAWAFPCTVLALFPGLIIIALGGNVRRIDHTLEVGIRNGQAQVPRWVHKCPFGAITLGHVIIGQSYEMLATLRSHEQVHVKQYERFGLFFLLAYPLAGFWALVRGRSFYAGNAFELQAVRESGNSGNLV